MSRRPADRLLDIGLRGAGLLSGLLLVGVVVFIAAEALPVFAEVTAERFLGDPSWHPTSGLFGLTPMVLGTLAVAGLALAIAGPLALAAAVFEHCYAPQALAAVFRRMVELLAGIPSVVFGLWGLAVLVPILARIAPPGTSLLAAGIVLAVMILPTAALFAAAALEEVPREQVRAATALGLGRLVTLRAVLLPGARAGILTGLVLALARALGETMAVMMVAGNVVRLPDGLLEPVRTLTANIALEMAYAEGTHREALFLSGLLVMGLTLLLVLAAQAMRRERRP